MKVSLATGRLQYEPKFNYRDGVLIGGCWYEETVKYVHEKHNHRSLYKSDFTPKSQIAEHKNDVWNNVIAGEGVDRAILMDHEGKLYYENYAGTTDLYYNWLPKCKKPHREYRSVKLTYAPEQDLALNYGNITNFGLKEQKRQQWAYENLTGSSSYTTESRDNYLKLDPSNYKLKIKGPIREISSKMYDVNHTFANLWPRNRRISLVPDFPVRVLERPYPHFYF